MKIKQLLAVAVLSAASLSAAAETCLSVVMQTGERQQFILSEKPEVTFDGGNLVIKCSDAETAIPRSDVSLIEFVDFSGGVADMAGDDMVFSFTDNSTVTVSGRKVSAVSVVDLRGTVLKQAVADSSGQAVIDVASLASGVYIVVIQNYQSVKILKK